MLSAAHVLAMDAKNLLDVVDSIRIRCPEVEEIILTGELPTGAEGTWMIHHQFNP